MTHTYHTTRL